MNYAEYAVLQTQRGAGTKTELTRHPRRRGELKGKVCIDRIDAGSVAAVRASMGFSQAKFAKLLGISIDTLQNWEQGRHAPTGAAKVLLRIAATNPEVVLQAVA